MADYSGFNLQRRFVHPFLSVFAPFWFLTMMLSVFVNSLTLPRGIVIFPVWYPVLLLLAGTVAVAAGNLLPEKRGKQLLSRLREFILLEAAAVLLLLLFHGKAPGRNFNGGSVRIWAPAVFAGGQWFLSLYLHRLFRAREKFVGLFAGKNAGQSRQIYKSNMHQAGDSLKAVASAKRLVSAFTAIGFFMCIVTSWVLGIHYSGLAVFVILLFFPSFALIIATFNNWQSVQAAMIDGCIVARREQRLRIVVAVTLIVMALIFAIPLTAPGAFLSESYLEALLDWLERLGSIEFGNREAEAPAFNFKAMGDRFDTLLRSVEPAQSDTAPLFTNLKRIAGWALLGALGAGTLIFLFLPLFRRNTGRLAARDFFCSIAAVIRNTLETIRMSFTGGAMGRKTRGAAKTVWRPRLPATAATGAPERRPAERAAAAHGRIRKAYFKFVRWGQRQGVAFTCESGPLEYAFKVAAVIPARAEECRKVAGLFEEAIFSNHELKEEWVTDFSRTVKKLTKRRGGAVLERS